MKGMTKNGKCQHGRVRKEIKTEVSVLTYVATNITLKNIITEQGHRLAFVTYIRGSTLLLTLDEIPPMTNFNRLSQYWGK